MNSPREMTVDEIRVVFLMSLLELVDEWDQYDQPSFSCRDRLEGLAFSFLVLLDGGHGIIPAWSVVPVPHPDDQEYDAGQNENWFPISPTNPYDIVNGELHNQFQDMLNKF